MAGDKLGKRAHYKKPLLKCEIGHLRYDIGGWSRKSILWIEGNIRYRLPGAKKRPTFHLKYSFFRHFFPFILLSFLNAAFELLLGGHNNDCLALETFERLHFTSSGWCIDICLARVTKYKKMGEWCDPVSAAQCAHYVHIQLAHWDESHFINHLRWFSVDKSATYCKKRSYSVVFSVDFDSFSFHVSPLLVLNLTPFFVPVLLRASFAMPESPTYFTCAVMKAEIEYM